MFVNCADVKITDCMLSLALIFGGGNTKKLPALEFTIATQDFPQNRLLEIKIILLLYLITS